MLNKFTSKDCLILLLVSCIPWFTTCPAQADRSDSNSTGNQSSDKQGGEPRTGKLFTEYGRFEVPWTYFDNQEETVDLSDKHAVSHWKPFVGRRVTVQGRLEEDHPGGLAVVDDETDTPISIESNECHELGEIQFKYSLIAYRENPFEIVDKGEWLTNGHSTKPDWASFNLCHQKELTLMRSFNAGDRVKITGTLCHYTLIRANSFPKNFDHPGKTIPGSHFFFSPDEIDIARAKKSDRISRGGN